MKNSRIWMVWFAGAIFFFVAAMVVPSQVALYVPVGVVLLILSSGIGGARAHLG